MLASSAFVLAALTMTGVYMKGQNVESRDDGYTLDFTALPNNADDKLQEITENNDEHLLKEDENIPGLTANNTAGAHAQDTLMTIKSELHLSRQLIDVLKIIKNNK